MSEQIDGINISQNTEGDVDFIKLKSSGISFAYHTATTGSSKADVLYAGRRQASRGSGVAFGALHQARPNNRLKSATAQANFFIKTAKVSPGDLIPAVAIYDPSNMQPNRVARWTRKFSDRVKQLTGYYPVLLSPRTFDRNNVPGVRWYPHHTLGGIEPVREDIELWQYTAAIKGIKGNIQVSRFMNDSNLSDIQTSDSPIGHMMLHLMHASLQFSDSERQREHDVKKIFNRAKRRNVAWITGTEASIGSGNLPEQIRKHAARNGYRVWHHKRQDAWIAVSKDIINGDWKTFFRLIIKGRAKQYGAKGINAVAFNNRHIGVINIIATHYLTKGAVPGDPRYSGNEKLSTDINKYAKEVGRGPALVFYGGDQNMRDATLDTFFGGVLISSWDELKKWPNTGHGNIDVIARSKKDSRVKAVYARAFTDKKFFLHTDHFLIETGYLVKTVA